jgi:allophanate hydrolase
MWARVDALAVPTAPCFPTLAELEADPLGPNARLGTYTNFVNLLDLAALAVPGPFRPDGLPAGLTLIAPRGSDARLAGLGMRFQAAGAERLAA